MAFDVKVRDIGEQLVLVHARDVTQSTLQEFLGEAMPGGWELGARFGGVSGPVVVIYEDQVNDERPATVEVLHPVAMGQTIPDDVPHRIEPAHREAYVTLPKRLVKFPEIMQGYQAVETWISDNGKTIAAGPREVYFADFMNAADDDLVTDIAFPITD
jgi:hypothetical protein